MNRDIRKRSRLFLWAGAFGACSALAPVWGQEAPGDQVFRFTLNQKFAATDNLRLNTKSVGTTYYSDTKLTFGTSTENGPNALNLEVSGIGRVVNDPLVGSDADFRDPRLDLDYSREGLNSRLDVVANYFKPDLAFLDPLQQPLISDQDIFRGGGTREQFFGGATLELGINSPIGFVFDVASFKRNYVDTVDPLLFSNERHTGAIGVIFRLSEVTQARIDWSEVRYRAADRLSTDRDTRRLTLGVDHAFSAIDTFSLDFGHSRIVETFDAEPGVENVSGGPVLEARFDREMLNGAAGASLDSRLTYLGRQNTFEVYRDYTFLNGFLNFSFGFAEGETFDPRPVGSLFYRTNGPRSEFTAILARTASISDTLSQATENTRLSLGYSLELTEVSGVSLDFYYGDISILGVDNTGRARERSSLFASYNHNITEEWDLVVGYEQRYFAPDIGPSSKSTGVYFTLQRDFEAFR